MKALPIVADDFKFVAQADDGRAVDLDFQMQKYADNARFGEADLTVHVTIGDGEFVAYEEFDNILNVTTLCYPVLNDEVVEKMHALDLRVHAVAGDRFCTLDIFKAFWHEYAKVIITNLIAEVGPVRAALQVCHAQQAVVSYTGLGQEEISARVAEFLKGTPAERGTLT